MTFEYGILKELCRPYYLAKWHTAFRLRFNGFKLLVERRRGGVLMGVFNPKRQQLQRLESKTLDARFLTEIQHGLNCSPFEAEAVLELVKEVYLPVFDQEAVQLHTPGRISLLAVAA